MALLIAAATLVPTKPTQHPPPMLCLVCGSLGGIDVILNVVLFVPLGAALVVNGYSAARALLVCLASTVAIEALQFSIIAGRDASVGDLITNTTGGAIGIALASQWRGWIVPTRNVALALSAGWALLFFMVTTSTAYLLKPHLRRLALWGQLGPREHPNFAPYRGTVHRFTVVGVEIPYNRVPAPDLERLYAGWNPPAGAAEITTGETGEGTAAIARLGSSVEEVYFLGEDGNDLLFRTTLETRRWRLRVPAVRLPHAFRRPGERMTVEGEIADAAWVLRAKRGNETLERRVPFGVSLGWSLLLPFDHPLGQHFRWFGGAWLAALMLPCGYWARFAARGDGASDARPRRWTLLVPLIALGAGIGAVAAHFALLPPHWSEWLGASVGGALGYATARSVERHHFARATP